METFVGILYIEPKSAPASEPVIDELTRKMTASFRLSTPGAGHSPDNFRPGSGWRGFHTCSCGASSSNLDYQLTSGEVTNSLCVHYLAFHRHDVPPEQLAKVAMLDNGEEEPTIEELSAPRRSNDPWDNLRGGLGQQVR